MVNEKTTPGAGANTSSGPFPTSSVVLCAVFYASLFPLLQQVFGDGWTILGAVVGAALGALGSGPLDRKVGGYRWRWIHRLGSSKPLSRKWAVAQGVWMLVTFGLLGELIWHRLLVGLAVGAFFGTAIFAVQLLIESHRHAAPRPTPWAPIVGGGVGCVIGVIVGGVCLGLYGDLRLGLCGGWLNGFTGMMAGAAVGAIVHNPK